MATRTALADRWHDLMDINVSTIATGEATIEDVGWQLFHFILILEIASGQKKTWSDQWEIHNALSVFNPAPVTLRVQRQRDAGVVRRPVYPSSPRPLTGTLPVGISRLRLAEKLLLTSH